MIVYSLNWGRVVHEIARGMFCHLLDIPIFIVNNYTSLVMNPFGSPVELISVVSDIYLA